MTTPTLAAEPSLIATGERPLAQRDRTMLVLATPATLLAFYLASAVVLCLVALLVVVLLIAAVGAARFGASRFIAPILGREWVLLRTLVRNLWLRDGDEYRLMLPRERAPRLFAMLDDLCARTGVAVPTEVAVEMNAGAWVHLKGYRRGAGRTTLGIGYDLLATLDEAEVEGVLAHEMSHARLIQRGFSSWLKRGVGRLANVTNALEHLTAANRAARNPSTTAEQLYKGADRLTRIAARLAATYSRQMEFEADRGAAEICGAGTLRSSLLELDRVTSDLARLPWNERVARLESDGSFADWLAGELRRDARPRVAEPAAHAADPYSTHPTTRDRLQALPPGDAPMLTGRRGLQLLADPDGVARDLLSEILRVAERVEAQDADRLRKQRREWRRTSRIFPRRWPGLVLILVGGVGVIYALSTSEWGWLAGWAGVTVAGVFALRAGRHRDALPLPVPAFGTLTSERPEGEVLSEAEAVIEEELRARVGPKLKSRAVQRALVAESYAQLAARDYLRAHVAARLAYNGRNTNAEAALALTVASAGLGLQRQCYLTLDRLRFLTGHGSRGTVWGAAWAMSLVGDWERTEMFLLELLRTEPDQPTFLALLALARARRGKLQTAVEPARRAAEGDANNSHPRGLLVDLLLDAGRLRDAEAAFAPLVPLAEAEHWVARLQVRLCIMQRRVDDAIAAARTLQRIAPEPRYTAWVGQSFEEARLDEPARTFYQEALAAGHYPECLVGLARIAAAAGDRAAARAHLLAALDTEREAAKGAGTPQRLFLPIVQQLNALDDRLERCEAWIAELASGDAHPLSGCKVVVCATDERSAREHLREVALALRPGGDARLIDGASWRSAPRDQQPIRPVAPGVQAVLE